MNHNGNQFGMSAEEEAEEKNAKLVAKYGNEGSANSEEEQEYLEKKRPH
jgi:hypothetical protein